ncbi:MAG TPA: outer membrane beta-barrel protein [Polyangiaceae bacterium]|nr:outer membrane beta-barrel protein [Polyangiaceae bacterium]
MRRAALPMSLAVLAIAPAASAFERQWHVGGGGGIAVLAESGSKAGPVAGLHGAYGISDTFDVRAALLGSVNRLDGEPFELYSATAGLAYKLDVLSWIPYAGVQVGYYRLGKGPRPGDLAPDEPGFSLDLGLDYAVRRHLGLGLELRFHGFLGEGFASLADAPYFTGLLRAEYRWGW